MRLSWRYSSPGLSHKINLATSLIPSFRANLQLSDWFPKAGFAPPTGIMNPTASLSLQITQIRRDNPDISIEFGVMYLNKILHSSHYVPIHQFLLAAYMAASQINEHVWSMYNKWGSTDTIKNKVIKVYDELLKLEVDVK